MHVCWIFDFHWFLLIFIDSSLILHWFFIDSSLFFIDFHCFSLIFHWYFIVDHIYNFFSYCFHISDFEIFRFSDFHIFRFQIFIFSDFRFQIFWKSENLKSMITREILVRLLWNSSTEQEWSVRIFVAKKVPNQRLSASGFWQRLRSDPILLVFILFFHGNNWIWLVWARFWWNHL